MRKHGFTLLESVVVLCIIAIVAAILTPVFARARKSSQIHSSLERLRQIQLAVAIYRQESGEGGYLTLHEAGLPTSDYVMSTWLGFGIDFWRSPCGVKTDVVPNTSNISYAYRPYDLTLRGDPTGPYNRLLQTHEEDTLLVIDLHCVDSAAEYYSANLSKRGLGVTIGGRLIDRFRPGDIESYDWWY